MAEVRKYEVPACPEHGTEKIVNGLCRVVTKRTARFTTYCHQKQTVTAIDQRDVEPLVEAARSVLGQRITNATASYLPDNPVVRGKLDALQAALDNMGSVSNTETRKPGEGEA